MTRATPYTRALLAALPNAHQRRGVRGLAGRPPSQVVTGACAFAPRCPNAAAQCLAGQPVLEPLPGGRAVRCVRHAQLEPGIRQAAEWALPAQPQPSRLLEVTDLWCRYRSQAHAEAAGAGVCLAIDRGEVVGVVGESGSGKSTLLRAIAGLHPPCSGAVRFASRDLAPTARARSYEARRGI